MRLDLTNTGFYIREAREAITSASLLFSLYGEFFVFYAIIFSRVTPITIREIKINLP